MRRGQTCSAREARQVAKSFGAEVTGVCSTRNVDMVRSAGADHIIDYTKEDFTRGRQRYDFILDNVGNHSLSDTRRALAHDGTLQSTGGGHSGGAMGTIIKALVLSRFVRQQLGPSIKFANRADLVVLKELIEAGKITPVIDGTYPLGETAGAIAHVGEGHARGTVIITVQMGAIDDTSIGVRKGLDGSGNGGDGCGEMSSWGLP